MWYIMHILQTICVYKEHMNIVFLWLLVLVDIHAHEFVIKLQSENLVEVLFTIIFKISNKIIQYIANYVVTYYVIKHLPAFNFVYISFTTCTCMQSVYILQKYLTVCMPDEFITIQYIVCTMYVNVPL